MYLGRRRPSPWKRHLPKLEDAAGQAICGQESLDELWLSYFGDMELGQPMETNAFLDMSRQRLHNYDDFLPDAEGATYFELYVERAFRSTKRHKVTGLDMVPGGVLKKLPSRLAAAYFPLMLKASTRLQQCVPWRGGVLAECYKQSGPVAQTTSYRSLFVSSMPGKAYHRIIREKVLAQTENMLADTHFGARRGASVLIPSQIIILFQKWQKKLNQSAAVVFLDTRSAYTEW